jgi:ABC-2 type transport system permease protein
MNDTSKAALDRMIRKVTRTSAFLRKDVVDFLRQPRLVLALVLGPFLILLLFGLGFKSEAADLRTLIVVSEDNPLRSYVEENAETLVRQLELMDIVDSEPFARHQLLNDRVDIVIVIPDNVVDKIESNQQAVFVTLHNTIDPTQSTYVRAFTNVYVNEANRRAHLIAVREAQGDVSEVEPEIEEAREDATNLEEAMERGDEEAAWDELFELRRDLSLIQAGLGPTQWLLMGVGQVLSDSPEAQPEGDPTDLLSAIQENLEELSEVNGTPLINEQSLETVRELKENLTELELAMEEFRRTDPNVVASPFVGETRTIGLTDLSVSDYYIPATISLLLQHLCVTFGALSIVSERQTGTIELFRASPLAALEVLVGKYLGYWLAASLVASALTGLLLFVLQAPMLGIWWEYAATLGALMFTSLGLGFLISILARSISQAVQYSMIALLASVFFSGFFLSLDLLHWTVRILSWFIPAAYGIRLLQDIMLRGLSFQNWQILILSGIGLGLFILAWVGLRQVLARA